MQKPVEKISSKIVILSDPIGVQELGREVASPQSYGSSDGIHAIIEIETESGTKAVINCIC